MTELAPCPSCKRHVAVRETRCPFCATALGGLRAMHRIPGRLARAAVFTAALTACSDNKPAEPPATPAGSAQGSDDLEKLLDHDGTTVQHATPADAAVADADIDAALDAGIPVDAGLSQEELDAKAAQRKAWREKKRKELEERKKRVDIINAKPYGAPPARRRIV